MSAAVMTKLYYQAEPKECCDIIMRIFDSKSQQLVDVECHRVDLARNCKYFHTVLCTKDANSNKSIIELPLDSFNNAKIIVLFIKHLIDDWSPFHEEPDDNQLNNIEEHNKIQLWSSNDISDIEQLIFTAHYFDCGKLERKYESMIEMLVLQQQSFNCTFLIERYKFCEKFNLNSLKQTITKQILSQGQSNIFQAYGLAHTQNILELKTEIENTLTTLHQFDWWMNKNDFQYIYKIIEIIPVHIIQNMVENTSIPELFFILTYTDWITIESNTSSSVIKPTITEKSSSLEEKLKILRTKLEELMNKFDDRHNHYLQICPSDVKPEFLFAALSPQALSKYLIETHQIYQKVKIKLDNQEKYIDYLTRQKNQLEKSVNLLKNQYNSQNNMYGIDIFCKYKSDRFDILMKEFLKDRGVKEIIEHYHYILSRCGLCVTENCGV